MDKFYYTAFSLDVVATLGLVLTLCYYKRMTDVQADGQSGMGYFIAWNVFLFIACAAFGGLLYFFIVNLQEFMYEPGNYHL